MSMPVEPPARRPGLKVYGLIIVVVCCLPGLLLGSLL